MSENTIKSSPAPQLEAPIIQLQNTCRYYVMGGETIRALDGVSLNVEKNDYIAVIGSSGSGKSTMLNILGCLDKPTDGKYILNGTDVSELSQDQLSGIRNKEIGFIFQSFNLIARTSALVNVMRPLIYRGVPKKQRVQMAMAVLKKVGLEGREGHLPNQLSGGQRQRVAIARALVTNPALLLADEPTGNLDTSTSVEIMALFDQLIKEGQTIIIVTHETEVANHCKRVVTISDGHIISDHVN
jgi:putative ABC transport system ATP-binding protein